MNTTTLTAPMATENALMVGGWTNFSFTLTPKAQEVFKKAVNLIGVDYTPLAFATQVVAGTNWCFLAKGAVVVPGAPEIAALLRLAVPGLPVHTPLLFVALAVGVSVGTGLLSGLLPARRAARLDPIEALRAE